MKRIDSKSESASGAYKPEDLARVVEVFSDDNLGRLARQHAPADWQSKEALGRIRNMVMGGEPVPMVVLSADIRRSTFVMKESIDFKEYARLISGVVSGTKKFVNESHGCWFDKFMGDGFLTYWICDEQTWPSAASNASMFARVITSHFQKVTVPELRRNSKNFPGGVGLCVGLDYGPVNLTIIADDLTIVGPPVVGAVRMANAATQPEEILCNVHFATQWEARKIGLPVAIRFEREVRPTKEYPQEVYRMVDDSSVLS